MSTRVQIASITSGLMFAVLFTVGWWFIAGFVPPHAPGLDAAAIAGAYGEGTGFIRFGILLAMFSAGLTIPFVAVIAIQMRRIEGRFPILTYCELVAGAVTVILLTMPTVMWSAAAFRPDRGAELIQLMNDFAWLCLLMTFCPFFVQLGSFGLAVLSDRHAPPLFPRWLGYFNIWVAILFVPGALVTFFKAGPFAWNGIIGFWVPLTAFLLWYLVMFFALLKAVRTPLDDD
ncbi:MAG: hypothetical protein ACU85V_15565 [Gammaproteobacteria bacterium]